LLVSASRVFFVEEEANRRTTDECQSRGARLEFSL